MPSSQAQRRPLDVMLHELEDDILRRDDFVHRDLQRAQEQLNRILEAIRVRCGERQRVTTAFFVEPGSAGDAEPTMRNLPASRYEAETMKRGSARRDSGIARRPTEPGYAANEEHVAELQSKPTWVDTMADSLDQKRSRIENHAKLSLEKQLNFDWTQGDVRIMHCLAGRPKESEGYLRSLAARSLALQFEKWSCTETISQQAPGKVVKYGKIAAFVNTLDVQQEDKKQVTAVIGVGRKILLLETTFGCRAISTVVAFVWRSFCRARDEDITKLGSKLQHCWLHQYAKENQTRFDEGINLYEEKRLRRKRQFSCSSQDESAPYKRARPDDDSGVRRRVAQAALSKSTGMQSSQTAEQLGNAVTGRWGGCTPQTSEQSATATILASGQGYAVEGRTKSCQPGMLTCGIVQSSATGAVPARSDMQWNHFTGELETSMMPHSRPRWQCSTKGPLPALNDAQWNDFGNKEIEASIMSPPLPQWQSSLTGAVPILSDDCQWSTKLAGHEMQAPTSRNDQWNPDEIEFDIMPDPSVGWSELSSLTADFTAFSS